MLFFRIYEVDDEDELEASILVFLLYVLDVPLLVYVLSVM